MYGDAADDIKRAASAKKDFNRTISELADDQQDYKLLMTRSADYCMSFACVLLPSLVPPPLILTKNPNRSSVHRIGNSLNFIYLYWKNPVPANVVAANESTDPSPPFFLLFLLGKDS